VVDDWGQLSSHLPLERMWFFSKWARRPYHEASYRPGDVLVFGSETQGLPASLLHAHWPRVLRIPIRAEVRSLNLSVSVAVAVFEAVRQIGWLKVSTD